jgi:hypothetical protein
MRKLGAPLVGILTVAIAMIASFAFAPLLSAQAAPEAAPDKAALTETLVGLEKQSWEAWKNRDGKFFQEFLSDDHVELGAGGAAGKAEVVESVASPACTVKSYAVDHFKLAVLDTRTALLTYHAAQDTTCGGKAVPSPAWVSSLYIKRGDRWLNVLYQQTPTPKPTPKPTSK